MPNVGRQLLCLLRKSNRSNPTVPGGGHAHSFCRHTNSLSNLFFSSSTTTTTTAGIILSKSPQAHFTQIFRATIAEHASVFSRRVAIFKHTNAFIRNLRHSYYNMRNGSRRYYRGSSLASPEGVVFSLIGANVVVFELWRWADRRFMVKNFMISVDNFLHGRVHTLITCAFSHIMPDHLFVNMFILYSFGSNIGRIFGAKYLLKLYLAGAVGGSILYLINEALIVPWRQGIPRKNYNPRYSPPALGASAAVNAIVLLDIFLYPKSVHYLNFFIPVPAFLLGALYIGLDLWRAHKRDTEIAAAAHLGGALVAALAWAKIRRFWI